MNQRIPNPDCRDGKHTICDGHGWDIDADTAVRCPCACHLAQHIQHAVPAVEHKACTCGARKTRDHCTCKHRADAWDDNWMGGTT